MPAPVGENPTIALAGAYCVDYSDADMNKKTVE